MMSLGARRYAEPPDPTPAEIPEEPVSVGTAFYPRQQALNTKQAWGEWAGYFAPAVYADFHDIEYSAIREAAAVIDTSPLYKYVVRGTDAVRLLDRVITRDASKQQVDQVYYTPWCDEAGKVIDDGTITRIADTEYRITAADPCYRWFLLNATGLDVEVQDVSESLAGLALQGKLSREVLEAATRQDWADVKYFRHRRTEIGGVDVSVTRTGYTGDRGPRGKPQPGGAGAPPREGGAGGKFLPPPPHGEGGRRRQRHTTRLPRRRGLRAVDPRRWRPRGLGRDLRGRRAVRDLPRRDP